MSLLSRVGYSVAKPLLIAIGIYALSACSPIPDGEIQGLAGRAIELERMRNGLQRKTIEIDGWTIPYLEAGQGEPLILVHGFGGSKDNFVRVAKPLAKTNRVIALDLPGFGATRRDPDGDYSIPTQVERLHQFIEKLGIQRAHLGGNSMGGYIVGMYAAKYPEAVESVWFLNPAGIVATRKSEVLQHFAKTGEVLLSPQTREEYDRMMGYVFHKRPGMVPGFILDALADRAIADRPLHLKIYNAFKKDGIEMDKVIGASGYKNPALIVWGDDDRVLHKDGAESLKQALPQAQVIIMKDMGHCPMLERPEDAANDYLSFRGQK